MVILCVLYFLSSNVPLHSCQQQALFRQRREAFVEDPRGQDEHAEGVGGQVASVALLVSGAEAEEGGAAGGAQHGGGPREPGSAEEDKADRV